MCREALVGILAGDAKEDRFFYGNVPLFKAIQKQLLQMKGGSFVFTPSSLLTNKISGFQYEPDTDHWKAASFPYPDVVYNRYPFRKEEQNLANIFSSLKERNIPYFNRRFFNKWEVIRCLRKNAVLSSLIPDSKRITSKQDLSAFLNNYHAVYVKPAFRSEGKGVLKIKAAANDHYELLSHNRMIISSSFEEIWKKIENIVLNETYIVQQEAAADYLFGMKYDLRVLVHFQRNQYNITGIGLRASRHITTHTKYGGMILPFSIVEQQVNIQHLQTICHEIGKTLSNCFQFVGEFSMDVGMDKKGNFYLYEINSKPMAFDEKEIFNKGIAQLSSLFFLLAEKKNTSFPF